MLVLLTHAIYANVGSAASSAFARLANNQKHVMMVTGGTRGIGRQACEFLAQVVHRDPRMDASQWTLVVTGRTEAGAQSATERLISDLPGESRGLTVQPLVLDVADAASRDAAVQVLGGILGKGQLDALINNAGIGLDMPWSPPKPPSEQGEVASRTLSTNFLGPLALTFGLISAGLLRTGSRVVNVSAGAGHVALWKLKPKYQNMLLDSSLTTDDVMSMGHEVIAVSQTSGKKGLESTFGCSYVYGLSKLCLSMASRTMAIEHPSLIVNACNPGFVLTDMTKGSAAKAHPAAGAEVVVHCAISKRPEVLKGGSFFKQDLEVMAWDDKSLAR